MASGDKVFLSAKRTTYVDAEGISNLVRKSVTALFGNVDIIEVIEKSNFSLTLTEKTDMIVAQASFCDYPNLSEVDSAAWEGWIADNFNLSGALPVNTLFLRFFVARDEYCLTAMNEILRIAFTALPSLQYIFLVVPPQTKADLVFQHFFTPVQSKSSIPHTPPYTLRVAKRHKYYPTLHIREAKVEDNDDVLPIFKQCNQNLDKQYGDYFIAEMIESQDKSHRTIVAEVNGLACGFASLTSDVDLDVLKSCFDLEPFCGLRKVHSPEADTEPLKTEESRLESVGSSVMDKQLSSVSQVTKLSAKETGSQTAMTSQASLHKQDSTKSPFATPTHSRTAVREASSSKSQLLQSQKSKASTTAIEPKLIQTELSKSQVAVQDSFVLEEGTGDGETKDGRGIELEDPSASTKVEAKDSQVVGAGGPETLNVEGEEDCGAVSIQLFAIDQKYEMRSVDFLPAIFTLFPEKDFIIISQPYSMPDFPLLSVFTRAIPLPTSSLSQELYVFHKCALLETFAVRFAVSADLDAVQQLVNSTSHGDTILHDVENYLAAKRDKILEGAARLFVLVAVCLDQIVGLAVLRQEESLDFLRSHYNLEDFIYFNYHLPEEHGHLHHFILNPVFHCLGRHFLTEVLRHTHKTCLYYTLYPADEPNPEGLKPHTAVGALPLMVQVQPRRQVQYNEQSLGINAPRDVVLKRAPPFALYHVNRKLTHEPKVQINSRIVIVGASDTGISVLEAFITANPHLQFNNLTLVSSCGLPLPRKGTHFLSNSYAYTVEDHHRMALKTWLNVVRGTVVQLNREDKQLVVVTEDEEAIISYEYLVFATGTQYCIEEGREEQSPPANVYTLNDSEDEENAAVYFETLSADRGKVVVYGSTMDVFTAIEGLLKLGMKGEDISVVHPSVLQCFNNPTVEGRVKHKMEKAGIAIHSGYHLLCYNDGETLEGDKLKSVSFIQNSEEQEVLKIECDAMLYLHERKVDSNVFRAVNGAYLVFDRRLVIDSTFQTNDPCIFAAGPLTKFSRRYHSEQWTHANFNSKEVGKKLAGTLLPIFDPLLMAPVKGEQDQDLIPSFHQPVIRSGLLPGGFHYLHVEKPNTGESLAVMAARDDYGRELVTGSGDSYFRIHVNSYNRIQTITCLNTEVIDTDNIVNLYGLHEKYLNNMVSRYDEKLITDFFSFFKEAWATAIFHDRFSVFKEDVSEFLQKRNVSEGKSFQEEVVEQLPEDLRVSKGKRDSLSKAFLGSPVKSSVEHHLLSYFAYNSYHLPMYAKPNML